MFNQKNNASLNGRQKLLPGLRPNHAFFGSIAKPNISGYCC